jgi:2-amino-4-hydroxy-6-hydroxymethyldihydropteridine diphosphokinase
MRVGIALGSNLGDRVAYLRAAAAAIRRLAEPPVLVSRVYETAPVDCPPGSPSFLNAAMEIGYSGSLADLLAQLQAIEQANARPAAHDRNSPRTVDLDILYADNEVVNEPNLILPHPRITERLFVLQPLSDIVPNRQLPGSTTTIAERAKKLQRLTSDHIKHTDVVDL